jgi:hypothetical protein
MFGLKKELHFEALFLFLIFELSFDKKVKRFGC